jgi:hypothetical protein
MRDITLVYIGDYLGLSCTVSNPQGGYGTCPACRSGDPVSVTPGTNLAANPSSEIEFGDLVTLNATNSGDLPHSRVQRDGRREPRTSRSRPRARSRSASAIASAPSWCSA